MCLSAAWKCTPGPSGGLVILRSVVEKHQSAHRLVFLQKSRSHWEVGYSWSCGARVLTGSNPSWTCFLQKSWLLPCSHILRGCKFIRYDTSRLPVGHWGYDGEHVSWRSPSPKPMSPIREEHVAYASTDKMFLAADTYQDICVSLISLGKNIC